MRKPIRYATITFVFVATAIQFIRPARTNPRTDPQQVLKAHVTVPREVAAVLDRSCRDCHSNETRWPWYSHVAPVSWFVIDHVNHARSHFNYSEWSKYPPAEVAKLIEGSCELARKGAMPLPSYLWRHRNARLSAFDIAALCTWTRAQAPGD